MSYDIESLIKRRDISTIATLMFDEIAKTIVHKYA